MRWLPLGLALSVLALSPAARAAWPLSNGEERDLDRADMTAGGVHRAGSGDSRARSWFSLAGYERVFAARRDVGVFAVLGLALDRIATGPVHAISDRIDPPTPPPAAPPPDPRLVLDARLARGTVAAAWRAAGLGVDDAKIDAIVARARLSAVLPETRLRAMRIVDDQGHTDATPSTDTIRYYAFGGASLWLEARLTWHLDRLLYADDEPTLERVRLERIDARARVAAKVLELVFQWQRALVDEKDAPPGTREELDATMRALEAQIALDVLTGGWFSKARATSTGPPS